MYQYYNIFDDDLLNDEPTSTRNLITESGLGLNSFIPDEADFLVIEDINSDSLNNSDREIYDAPAIENELTEFTTTENVESSFTIPENTFSDDLGNGLTYSATLANDTVLPDWIQFDPTNRTFTFNAATENIGSYQLKVISYSRKISL
ncbi:hypothetical protein H1P_3360007 [Hyella patelloides LEGE 07179]|uniref:Dystroglycan-type cadherin-like domain-containing protein n=1 Tax=Hyella patelloides LEGE 07179 TaxID=945734 RepID=A0A563VVM1_9CYAN|nr:putative Ig domain-containing protein [Hyella patelloides]VEP15450.1 hypothetical protein H1P_3360007 [Hyella patelloides LEGE 07179]